MPLLPEIPQSFQPEVRAEIHSLPDFGTQSLPEQFPVRSGFEFPGPSFLPDIDALDWPL